MRGGHNHAEKENSFGDPLYCAGVGQRGYGRTICVDGLLVIQDECGNQCARSASAATAAHGGELYEPAGNL